MAKKGQLEARIPRLSLRYQIWCSKEDVVVGLSTRDKMEEIVSRVRTWIFEHVVQTMVDTVSSTIISVS